MSGYKHIYNEKSPGNDLGGNNPFRDTYQACVAESIRVKANVVEQNHHQGSSSSGYYQVPQIVITTICRKCYLNNLFYIYFYCTSQISFLPTTHHKILEIER